MTEEQQNKTKEKLKRNFIKKFSNLDEYGFYDFVEFEGDVIGFSIKKKFKNKDGNATMISVGIRSGESIKKVPLYISATYGKEGSEGIQLRSLEEIKLTEPVDMESRNEYFYDINEQNLYRKNKEINACQLINGIYELHIKSTELFKGFFLRMKIRFWRVVLKTLFKLISEVFYNLLFIISGNRYKYESFLEREILNDRVIKSKWPEQEGLKEKEELRESKKFRFFDYEASSWSIIFYCSLHLGIYAYFMYIGYKPLILAILVQNNFLILVYVVVSLWSIESVMPKILMFLIKYFSKLSDHSSYRKIKL